MAVFIPRTHNQILRELVSKVVSRTDVSDVSVGSTLFTILNAMALEIANTESRLSNLRKGFALENATGSELDQRVSELPPVGITRKVASPASGSVLTITRTNFLTDPLTIPRGSTVQRSADGVQYTIPYNVTFAAGFDTVENVYVVCTQNGSTGNCLEGEIDTIVSMPDDVLTVRNDLPLTSGNDRETDTSLRQRAYRFINSLGRANKSAIEFLGTSFVGSQGESFKFAAVYEDPERPGYSELIVDDGSGLKDPGIEYVQTRDIVINSDNANKITHERPATAPLGLEKLVLTRSGVEVPLLSTDFRSIPERGIIFFRDGLLQKDDVLTIRGFNVYQGLIAEIQREIEGDVNRGVIMTGFRAAGTRVRVTPPEVTQIKLKIGISPFDDVDFEGTAREVRQAIIDFVSNLSIGEKLIPSELTTSLMITQNITSCVLYVYNTDTVLSTVYPGSAKHVLRIKSDDIDVVSKED